MSAAAPPRRVRGRLRGRLIVGLTFLAVLVFPGSAHAAPPPQVSAPVSAGAEAGVKIEIETAVVAEAPAAPAPAVVEPRVVQAPVPAERVTVKRTDRSATGERAPPRPVR